MKSKDIKKAPVFNRLRRDFILLWDEMLDRQGLNPKPVQQMSRILSYLFNGMRNPFGRS